MQRSFPDDCGRNSGITLSKNQGNIVDQTPLDTPNPSSYDKVLVVVVLNSHDKLIVRQGGNVDSKPANAISLKYNPVTLIRSNQKQKYDAL